MRVTDQATRIVPAGWYQDPAISEQVRWWNGLTWTEHVREKPKAPVVSSTVATGTAGTETAEERIAAARVLERQFGIGTSENEIITGASALGYGTGAGSASAATPATHSDAVSAPATRRAALDRRPTSRTATGSAWLVALIPALTFLFALVAAYVYFYVPGPAIVFVLALAIPYLLGILWALGDGRALKARGFRPPRTAWALLGGLGYLIARRLRVAGSAPLIMFLILGAIAVAIPPLGIASGQVRPLTTALNIQKSISTTYEASGRAVSVTCPPFVDATTPGTLYTCSATTAIGTHRLVWVSIDGTDGQFSYSMAL
jgi:hypothetical protein